MAERKDSTSVLSSTTNMGSTGTPGNGKKDKIWTKLGKGSELPSGEPILSDFF